MIFIDQMKNLKIYRKPMFLPTIEDDKKKKSAIMLLTPNYESSRQLMNHPMTINRLRFQSYYLEQDVSYYITGKTSKNIINESYIHNATHLDLYHNINEKKFTFVNSFLYLIIFLVIFRLYQFK